MAVLNGPVIVTGASGFLGSHLMRRFPASRVIGVVNRNRPEDDGFTYLPLDLTHPDATAKIADLSPSTILHAAANASVEACDADPEMAQAINTDVPERLAAMAADTGCRFVLVSTDMVFDGDAGGYAETDKPTPRSRYGASKLAGERAVERVNPGGAIVRTALIYGRSVSPGRGSSFLEWVLGRFRAGERVPLFEDQIRTPILVADLCRALTEIAGSNVSGILHAGGAERLNRVQFGEYVCDLFGFDRRLLNPTRLADAPAFSSRPRDLSLNIDRLEQTLGWRPHTCRTGLATLA